MYSEKAVSDRFLLALLMAGIAHAVMILGVSFEIPKTEKIKKSLDVTLVRMPSPEAPKKAEFLSQENQFGSGNNEKKAIPKSEPLPMESKRRPIPPVHNQSQSSDSKPKSILTQAKSEKAIVASVGKEKHEQPQPHKISADALSRQIAELSAEFSQTQAIQAKMPKVAYINSVNAHKYKAAAYEKSWQEKIERIGNLNYPDEARRRSLSGSLLLSVGIKPDGSVYSVQVRRSSGHSVLDDAAVNIVQLAAPFSRFPEELINEADILVITRTWRFYNNDRMETSP
jgi:protein TonB